MNPETVRVSGSTRAVLRLIPSSLPPLGWTLAALVVSAAVQIVPQIWADVLGAVFGGGDGSTLGATDRDALYVLAGVGFLHLLLVLARNPIRAYVETLVIHRVRARVHRAAVTGDAAFHHRFDRGQLQLAAMQMPMALSGTLLEVVTVPVGGLIAIAYGTSVLARNLDRGGVDATGQLLLVVVTLAVVGVTGPLGQFILRFSRRLRDHHLMISRELSTSMDAPLALHLADASGARLEAFEATQAASLPQQVKTSGLVGLANSIQVAAEVLLVTTLAVVLLVQSGEGGVAASARVYGPLLVSLQGLLSTVVGVTGLMVAVQQAWPELEFLASILDAPVSVVEPDQPDPRPLPPAPAVELASVRFRFPGADQLLFDGLDLRIEPGETMALVSESGSGKSTLLGLLGRSYDVEAGSVKIDGRDIRTLPFATLRRYRSVARCAQLPILLDMSLRENFRLFIPDVTDPEIRKSLDEVELLDVFEERSPEDPLGLPVYANPDRGGLSGGQRKRIELARALCARPKLLLLDEPTTGVSEAAVLQLAELVRRLTRGMTCVVVEHDLEFVRRVADRVARIDDRKVAEVAKIEL